MANLQNALVLLLVATGTAAFELNLLHVNDVHNRIQPATASGSQCTNEQEAEGACFGGYAALATAVREGRGSNTADAVLFLDAGDEFMGTVWDTFYRGQATAQLQAMIGVDAMVLGNHEFDFGTKALAEYINRVNLTQGNVLGGCNINASKDPDLAGLIDKYSIFDFNGTKVALVGWITPETAFISSAGPNVTFEPIIPSVKNCIMELKQECPDCEIIIGLSHAGYNEDLKVAGEIPELDLIVGGHSHTFLYNGSTPLLNASDANRRDQAEGPYPTFVISKSGKNIPVVTAFTLSRYLGNLTVEFDDTGDVVAVRGNPILLGGKQSSNYVPGDPEIQAAIDKLLLELDDFTDDIIGSSLVVLDQRGARRGESNLGNLLCDVFLDYIQTNTTLEEEAGTVNICLQNGGGIRASLPASNITVGDALTVLPFGNTLTVKSVKGEVLLNELDFGLELNNGRFLQVGGLRVVYDPSKPVGSRLVSVEVNNGSALMPLDPCGTYNVLTNDFMGRGGDGYRGLAASPSVYSTGPVLVDLFIDHLKRFSPVAPKVEGRLVDCAPSNSTTPPNALCQQTPLAKSCSDPTRGLLSMIESSSRTKMDLLFGKAAVGV